MSSAAQSAVPASTPSIETIRRSCPTCEASCGLLVEVDRGDANRIVSIKGDPADHRSKGYVCAKSQAFRYVYEDQERLRHPVKRTAAGWEKISWEEALDTVASRLNAIRAEHGKDAIAFFVGEPTGHDYGAQFYLQPLMKSIMSERFFSAGTVDQHPQQMVCWALFGQQWFFPVPDIDHTDLFICMGGNPLVSQGSIMACPDVKQRLLDLKARGGKSVVIDPRRTETAEAADQHIFIKPGTDAFFLLAFVNVLFAENRIQPGRLAANIDGIEGLRQAALDYTPENTARITGVDPQVLRDLVALYCETERAALYGRIGLCSQKFGTLAHWLLCAISLLTGKLDNRGGMMFPRPATGAPGPAVGLDPTPPYGRWHSRVRGFPETCGELPSSLMAEEIMAPGKDKVRAVITMCGNPVLSVPNGKRIREALETVDFMVSLDIYINETTSQADIILPSTVAMEHNNYDLAYQGTTVRNFANYSPAILPREEGLKDLWEILLEISARLAGLDAQTMDGYIIHGLAEQLEAAAKAAGRTVDAATIVSKVAHWGEGPERMLDAMLRNGPYGDGFDDNTAGLSLQKMIDGNACVDLGPMQPQLPRALCTPDSRIDLMHEIFVGDLPRLRADFENTAQPGPNDMLLIGRRHVRDMNTWLHNLQPYVKGKSRCTLKVNPADAARIGLQDGGSARIASRVGEAQVPVEITDEIMPGVVSLPHGFGHRYRESQQSIANSIQPGVSCNDLIDDNVLDVASGNSVVNGAAVQVFPA
jgi:anaerobic selenocysteine-containing dehydrogenase